MEDDNDSGPTQTTVIDEYDTKYTETADVDKKVAAKQKLP